MLDCGLSSKLALVDLKVQDPNSLELLAVGLVLAIGPVLAIGLVGAVLPHSHAAIIL